MASYSAIAAAYPKQPHQLSVPSSCRGETQSETSSTDSEMSNLHTIAAQLGMNMKELSIDQFKVEREKLETMMTEECVEAGTSTAEKFFSDIMEETSTYIKWPRRLKIGAKTRKDPHVEIIGKYENVKRAKEQVIGLLNSRGNRVTMKLNVSYRDHSFIIGKCGKSIKQIMDDTKTHIHFPDSNRFNKHEKSNQVSFTGPLDGVEKARARVRKSSPLVLQFELPVISNEQKVPEVDSPLIKDICTNYDVQVSYSHRSKLHATSVLVKGCESNSANVKVATQRLIGHLCQGVSSPIEVNIQMDVSPQYHFIVKGKDNRNLKRIMELSKTKIIFPDLNDTNFSPLRRCQISITGTIEGVCEARDYIIGNLPVALMFEYPDKNIDLDEIAQLNKTLDVFITVRSKSHHGALCIVIKGIEKYVGDIYEARSKILKLNHPTVAAEIPSTYYFQYENKNQLQIQSLFQMYSNSPTALDFPHEAQLPYTPTENLTHLMNRMSCMSLTSPQQQQQQQAQAHQNKGGNPANYHHQNQPPRINIQTSPLQQHQQQHHQTDFHDNSGSSYQLNGGPSANVSPRGGMASTNTSGYHSVSSSTNSLDHLGNFPPAVCLTPIPSASLLKTPQEQQQEFMRRQGRFQSIGTSPMMLNRSPEQLFPFLQQAAQHHHQQQSVHQLMGHPMNQLQPSPGFEMKRNFDHSPIFDFDLKKLEGLKAMEIPPRADQPRTPTNAWAGIGLSRSSTMIPKTPSPFAAGANGAHPNPPPGISPYNLGKTGGILDSTPVTHRQHMMRHENIQSLLTSLRLEHYISNFVSNEIDLDMFSTLTEEDLQVLGITAFGPRKKLLMAINFLSTHHHSHGHLSPQVYHHQHQQQQQQQQHFLQQVAAMGAMGGRLPHGAQMGRGELKNPPGIPAGFEQKIQQQQQQQRQQEQQQNTNGNSAGQSQAQAASQGASNKSSPVVGAGAGGVSGTNAGKGDEQSANGNAAAPPKFSGSAAPGAERRTSNSS